MWESKNSKLRHSAVNPWDEFQHLMLSQMSKFHPEWKDQYESKVEYRKSVFIEEIKKQANMRSYSIIKKLAPVQECSCLILCSSMIYNR